MKIREKEYYTPIWLGEIKKTDHVECWGGPKLSYTVAENVKIPNEQYTTQRFTVN